MTSASMLLGALGLVCVGIAAIYCLLGLAASLVWTCRESQRPAQRRPPVTILKPLCGAEPGLYANLRSFCVQDYPQYQIVFGLRERSDPALAIAERLVAEFPALPIDIVISSRQHGSNRKVSSLINMLPAARYDVMVMADSDAFVNSDYLASVTAPLLDPKVGLVTCLYHGEPTRCVWSRLGAMYVNEWYMPSVLLAWLFGHEGYVSGQTLCVRRETLQGIGGLGAIADHLADDYRLGELVRAAGLRIVLSPYLLKAEHHEPTLGTLVRHESRWMRTLRALQPGSFRLLFFSFTLPLASVGLLLSATLTSFSVTPWILFQVCVLGRVALHLVHRLREDRPMLADLWLLPARDLLLCWVWYRALVTSRITWRGHEFDVDAQGIMRSTS